MENNRVEVVVDGKVIYLKCPVCGETNADYLHEIVDNTDIDEKDIITQDDINRRPHTGEYVCTSDGCYTKFDVYGNIIE